MPLVQLITQLITLLFCALSVYVWVLDYHSETVLCYILTSFRLIQTRHVFEAFLVLMTCLSNMPVMLPFWQAYQSTAAVVQACKTWALPLLWLLPSLFCFFVFVSLVHISEAYSIEITQSHFYMLWTQHPCMLGV